MNKTLKKIGTINYKDGKYYLFYVLQKNIHFYGAYF